MVELTGCNKSIFVGRS